MLTGAQEVIPQHHDGKQESNQGQSDWKAYTMNC